MTEAERKALAWRQVQHARKLQAERKAKEEAALRLAARPNVAERSTATETISVAEIDSFEDDFSQFDRDDDADFSDAAFDE